MLVFIKSFSYVCSEQKQIDMTKRKKCGNCTKSDLCKMKASCKSRNLDYCRFYDGDGVDTLEKDYLKEFETVARPLIKWLCKNQHPHVTAIITPTSCELMEGKCANPKIFDYVQD